MEWEVQEVSRDLCILPGIIKRIYQLVTSSLQWFVHFGLKNGRLKTNIMRMRCHDTNAAKRRRHLTIVIVPLNPSTTTIHVFYNFMLHTLHKA
jgi:hypothetical protein